MDPLRTGADRRSEDENRIQGQTVGYVILENEDALRLTVEVHKRMAEGWKPLGGVACYVNPSNLSVRYVQAMVRETVIPS